MGKEFGARFGGADTGVIKDMVSQGMLGNRSSVCLSQSIYFVHLVSKTANYIVYQFSIRPHGSYLEVQPI